MLDGFERSRSALPDAHLTFIFRGTALRPELERRLAARPGLADHVHLVGDVPPSRMEAFFSAADLFVLGSHREGSGYALIEALACAAIPVVTDIPSFRVLTDGGTLGPLWPPGDAPALAAALVSAARRDPAPLRAANTSTSSATSAGPPSVDGPWPHTRRAWRAGAEFRAIPARAEIHIPARKLYLRFLILWCPRLPRSRRRLADDLTVDARPVRRQLGVR